MRLSRVGFWIGALCLLAAGLAIAADSFPNEPADAMFKWAELWALSTTLVVVWYYTDRTRELVEQTTTQVSLQRESVENSRRPVLVLEYVERLIAGSARHIWSVRNIGPGPAVDSKLLIRTVLTGEGGKVEPYAFTSVNVGAIGASSDRPLDGEASELISGDGDPRLFVILAEGLDAQRMYVTYGAYTGRKALPILRHETEIASDDSSIDVFWGKRQLDFQRRLDRMKDEVVHPHTATVTLRSERS